MKKGLIAAAVVVGAVVLALVFGHKKTTPEATVDKPANANVNNTTPADSPAPVKEVAIDNFAFGPKTITVKKGTVVTWTNKDSAEHTVTFEAPLASVDSGTLGKNSIFKYTFKSTGTFSYHCAFHPEMTGTIVVTD
jgi:plastocyanin